MTTTPRPAEPATDLVPADVHAAVLARAEEIQGWGEAAERWSRDPVNQPRINDWLEAIGLDSERFRSGEAPPSMAQVWTMYGLGGVPSEHDPLHAMMRALTDLGFTAVLGTNCEQEYRRYLRLGEQVRVTNALVSVVGPKATGMGVGYFVTSRNTWWVGDEVVATMHFRVLKFAPKRSAR